MTESCRRCGGPAPVLSPMEGVEIRMPYCETCSPVLAAEEDAADRLRSVEKALDRAGATKRLLGQSLDSHPEAEASAAARAWIDAYRAGERKNLWLSGPVGLGKTGLAWGIVRELVESSVEKHWATPEEARGIEPPVPALLLRWADLLDDLKAAFGAERRALAAGDLPDPSVLLERAKGVPVLALDDLGRERPTPYAIEKLANLVSVRYDEMRPTVVTSNYSTRDLTARLGHENPVDGERLVSRLSERAVGYRFAGDSRRRAAQASS